MRYLAILATAMSLLLAGCATTIRSDVTAFNQWPAHLHGQSYVFDAPPAQQNTLEFQHYQALVRAQLNQLGFTEASSTQMAALKVALRYSTTDRPLHVVQSMPIWGPRYGFGWGYPGWNGYGRPYADPFIDSSMVVNENVRHIYERKLQVTLLDMDGQQLFDVTAHNTSDEAATPVVMAALISSAFAGFPGQSGVPHRVDVTLK